MLIWKGKAMVRSFRKPKQYLKKKRVCGPLKNNVAENRWGRAVDQMTMVGYSLYRNIAMGFF